MDRTRSTSPDRRRKAPKEFSFYKKQSTHDTSSAPRTTSGAVGSFSTKRDPLDRLDEKRRAAEAESRGNSNSSSSKYDRDSDMKFGRMAPRNARHPDDGEEPSRYSSEYKRDDRRDRDRRYGGGSGGGGRDYDRSYRDSRQRSPARTTDYTDGEPLRRVPTRDERTDDQRYPPGEYRGGGPLRRVETRDERSSASPINGDQKRAPPLPKTNSTPAVPVYGPMIEIIANDRLGRKGELEKRPLLVMVPC